MSKGPAVEYHTVLSLSSDVGEYVQQLRVISECLRSDISSELYRVIRNDESIVVGLTFGDPVSQMRFELSYMSKGPAVQ